MRWLGHALPYILLALAVAFMLWHYRRSVAPLKPRDPAGTGFGLVAAAKRRSLVSWKRRVRRGG